MEDDGAELVRPGELADRRVDLQRLLASDGRRKDLENAGSAVARSDAEIREPQQVGADRVGVASFDQLLVDSNLDVAKSELLRVEKLVARFLFHPLHDGGRGNAVWVLGFEAEQLLEPDQAEERARSGGEFGVLLASGSFQLGDRPLAQLSDLLVGLLPFLDPLRPQLLEPYLEFPGCVFLGAGPGRAEEQDGGEHGSPVVELVSNERDLERLAFETVEPAPSSEGVSRPAREPPSRRHRNGKPGTLNANRVNGPT